MHRHIFIFTPQQIHFMGDNRQQKIKTLVNVLKFANNFADHCDEESNWGKVPPSPIN